MYIDDEGMIKLIFLFFIFYLVGPGQFNHYCTKLSPLHQSIDQFLLLCTKMLMNNVLSI
jgi:hypothetical protein